MDVPFKSNVQVPGLVMEEPILVITRVPCAEGVQLALNENLGGTGVGVAVGDWQKVDTLAVPTLPPPVAVNTRVPKSPEVLILKDAFAANWKVLLAMGVPFRFNVQVPALVMDEPVLVMTKVPWASGVQLALSENVGGTGVGVAVGDWQKVEADAVPTLPPPVAVSSRVPKSPEVLILKVMPEFIWKVLLAMGVPFKITVQVPGLVMLAPVFVMVRVPCAEGVQVAFNENTGTVAWAYTGC
jgi:hypothetical protein